MDGDETNQCWGLTTSEERCRNKHGELAFVTRFNPDRRWYCHVHFKQGLEYNEKVKPQPKTYTPLFAATIFFFFMMGIYYSWLLVFDTTSISWNITQKVIAVFLVFTIIVFTMEKRPNPSHTISVRA